MKTDLNVQERLTAMSMLPPEGNVAILRTLRGLVKKLGLTDAEFKEYEIVQDGVNLKWNEAGTKGKEFEFGMMETKIIADELIKLNEQKKLKPAQLSLYEKFVEDPPKAVSNEGGADAKH
ncbi:MAG: hypothetical protein M0R66_01295 [Candidatus Omnitrophica bacterium]|nr:hypothetical protein [Candidatus Omnitrophota bacterium]